MGFVFGLDKVNDEKQSIEFFNKLITASREIPSFRRRRCKTHRFGVGFGFQNGSQTDQEATAIGSKNEKGFLIQIRYTFKSYPKRHDE